MILEMRFVRGLVVAATGADVAARRDAERTIGREEKAGDRKVARRFGTRCRGTRSTHNGRSNFTAAAKISRSTNGVPNGNPSCIFPRPEDLEICLPRAAAKIMAGTTHDKGGISVLQFGNLGNG